MNELSTTANFKIDEGFKKLIPPLSDEEYSQLEQNCTEYGIRDALTVCKFPGSENLLLLDGHNRFEIAKKCNLAYKTERLDFESREAAEEWIIKNQLGRRNIQPYVRAELALKLKPIIAKKAKENQGTRTDISQNSVKSHDTQKELAKAAGVSHDTIHKVEVIKEKADPEVIEKLRKGETTIHKEYVNIMAAEHESRKQEEARALKEARHRAEEFENSKVVTLDSVKQNNDDRERIFDNFRDEFSKMISHVRRFAIMAENGELEKVVKMTSSLNQITLSNNLQECYRSLLKIQRVVAEVMDEE